MRQSIKPLAATLALGLAATTAHGQQQADRSRSEVEARLIAVLKSDASRKARADACRELADVGSRASIEPLSSLLVNEELSHMARYALEPIPEPEVDAALRDALGKTKGRLQAGIIGSIGVRRDPRAVEMLVKKLDDKDADVAGAAARALGRIGTIDAANALQAALEHGPDANRLAVCEGLFRCAERLRVQGQRAISDGIYEALKSEKAPGQVRRGAATIVEGFMSR